MMLLWPVNIVWLVFILSILSIKVNSFFKNSWKYVNTRLPSLLDDSFDISPSGRSNMVLKRVLRTGNPSKIPQNRDTLEINWKIYSENGNILHDSIEMLEEPFSFTLGADPREVILGWELCAWTMHEGEVANLVIQPEFAFGVNGAESIGIPGNATVICDLSLERIIPSISRSYQSVGLNESIKDELMDKIQSRESPITEETIQNNEIIDPQNKTEKEVRYYDSNIHKIDPNLCVVGEGQGFAWEENQSAIDVEIPLLPGTTKRDLTVDIQAKSVKVTLKSGEVLLQGPLFGKVLASESAWTIVDSDPTAKTKLRGRKLVLSLEKSYASKEIWSTLFEREFIKNKQKMENQ